MASMKSQYGSKKGKQVFYASRNKGNINGIDEMNNYMRIGMLLAEAMGLDIQEAKKARTPAQMIAHARKKRTPLERAFDRIEPTSARAKRLGLDYNDPKLHTPKEQMTISDYSKQIGKGGGMSYEPDAPYTSDETEDPSTKKRSKKRR